MAEGGDNHDVLFVVQMVTVSILTVFVAAGWLRGLSSTSKWAIALLGLVCLAATISTIFSVDRDQSMLGLSVWIWVLALSPLVASAAHSEKWQETAVAFVVVTAFIQALLSHYVWWGGGGNVMEGGTFYSPNQYAGFLLLLAPIALSLLFKSRDLPRTVLMVLVGVVVYSGIFLSGSRWGLVSSVVGVLATLVAGRFGFRVIALRGTVLFLLLAGFLAFMTSRAIAPVYLEFRGGDLLGPAGTKGEGWLDGLEMRLGWAAAAFELGVERPLTGGGPGTFGERHRAAISADEPWSMRAHNDYLEFFADLGIFGALAFAGFSGYVLKRGWDAVKSRSSSDWTAGFFGGLVGATLHVLLDHDWSYPAFAGMVVVISMMILSRHGERRDEGRKAPVGGLATAHELFLS